MLLLGKPKARFTVCAYDTISAQPLTGNAKGRGGDQDGAVYSFWAIMYYVLIACCFVIPINCSKMVTYTVCGLMSIVNPRTWEFGSPLDDFKKIQSYNQHIRNLWVAMFFYWAYEAVVPLTRGFLEKWQRLQQQTDTVTTNLWLINTLISAVINFCARTFWSLIILDMAQTSAVQSVPRLHQTLSTYMMDTIMVSGPHDTEALQMRMATAIFMALAHPASASSLWYAARAHGYAMKMILPQRTTGITGWFKYIGKIVARLAIGLCRNPITILPIITSVKSALDVLLTNTAALSDIAIIKQVRNAFDRLIVTVTDSVPRVLTFHGTSETIYKYAPLAVLLTLLLGVVAATPWLNEETSKTISDGHKLALARRLCAASDPYPTTTMQQFITGHSPYCFKAGDIVFNRRSQGDLFRIVDVVVDVVPYNNIVGPPTLCAHLGSVRPIEFINSDFDVPVQMMPTSDHALNMVQHYELYDVTAVDVLYTRYWLLDASVARTSNFITRADNPVRIPDSYEVIADYIQRCTQENLPAVCILMNDLVPRLHDLDNEVPRWITAVIRAFDWNVIGGICIARDKFHVGDGDNSADKEIRTMLYEPPECKFHFFKTQAFFTAGGRQCRFTPDDIASYSHVGRLEEGRVYFVARYGA